MSAFIFGIPMVRVGIILVTPKRPAPEQKPAKNRFVCITLVCIIYEIDPIDATASQLMKVPYCREFWAKTDWPTAVSPSLPAGFGMLPTWHGNSAKPHAWGRSADEYAPA